MRTMNLMKKAMLMLVLLWTMISGAMATSTSSGPHDVMVGETKRIDLPASVTQNAYFSFGATVTNGTGYVRVKESNKNYVRVEGLAVTPDVGVIVTYSYQDQFYKSHTHDLRIRVKAESQSTTGTTEKDVVNIAETMTLKVGEAKQITASSSYGEVVFTWRSDDTEIVTLKDNVTGTGNNRITGMKAGTTVVTATSQKGGWAKCTVTVTDETEQMAATSVALSHHQLGLMVGQEFQLSAIVLPESTTDKSLTWSSTDSNIVTVDETGKIKVVKDGAAKIVVSTSNGLSDTCLVFCRAQAQESSVVELNDSEGISELPEKADVKYSRTFLKGWNSVCLPFALDVEQLGTGSQLAVFDKIVDDGTSVKITFTSVQRVDGGIPCLVYVPEELVFGYDEKDIDLVQAPLNDGVMKGSYTTSVIGGGCYKLNQSGTAWGTTKALNAVCAPFRAFIDLAVSCGADVEIKVSNK